MPDEAPDAVAAPARVHFDAILHPHRSLPPRGFAVLMMVLGSLSLGVGVVFVLVGAWPVVGFFGLDVLLLYGALRWSYRSAALYETVRLTDEALVVWRIDPVHEPRSWRFEPTWLQVAMEDPPQHHSQLTLSSHGRSLVIGTFLTPDERLALARALRAALAAWRGTSRGP